MSLAKRMQIRRQCDPLQERLVSDFGISKDEVKISTGKLDELRSISEISFAEKIRRDSSHRGEVARGLGLPFAYVFRNLKERGSTTAIEQIVRRILAEHWPER